MSELDPEVAAILAEVAARPGSKLFRVTPAQRRRQPLERVRVGPASAGLTLAERELVEVHASELARLLHHAFWLAVDEFWRGLTIERMFDGPVPAAWRARASEALVELPGQPRLSDGLGLLARCLGGETGALAGDLLIVALRLWDTENARNDLALDLVEAGQPEAARELLRGVLSSRPSRTQRWVAWRNIGYAHARERSYARASRAYAEAFGCPAAAPSMALDAFAYALLAGDEDEARRLGALVDEQCDGTDTRSKELLVAMSGWSFEPDERRVGRACLERIRKPLGRIPMEVARALL